MPKDESGRDETVLDTRVKAKPISRGTEVDIDRRYDLGPLLGRGGMGEVRLAYDARIGRDVAVKLMRTSQADADTMARFFREAQVQGSLEHPAIVPVHDLGIDGDGQPYFVMKRLAGTTLADVIAERTASDAQLAKWPRRLLLARLVDVCLAVELAHTRGVIHRDLKPANIMLGDFGEAYVLDWGLARIAGGTHSELAPAAVTPISVSGPRVDETAVGALLGTPGYMAPEQARGELVDARADVFSLGCVLYEILTNVPALPRGIAAIEATLSAAEHRPSRRTDVPPELDDLCARATAHASADRPTAREFADGIQAYLDGDRDLERRRDVALVHVARAEASLARSGDAARAEAFREFSRALALDPTNPTAQAMVAHLILEPPTVAPAAALADADEERGIARQKVLRWSSRTYLGLIPLLGLLFVFPVHHAWPIYACMGILGFLSIAYRQLTREPLPMDSLHFIWILALNTILLGMAACLLGPVLILPIFIVGSLAGFLMIPTAFHPGWLLFAHSLPFAIPVILELAGVTPRTFAVVDGGLVLKPWALELTPVGATVFVIVSLAMQFTNTTIIGLSVRRAQEQALNRVHVQSWHLKQLLPGSRQAPES